MAKTSLYRVSGPSQFKVLVVNDKIPKGEKGRWKEYNVSLRGGDTVCDCEDAFYRKRSCKHVKWIISQLKDKGGVLDFQHIGDYELLAEEVKRYNRKL